MQSALSGRALSAAPSRSTQPRRGSLQVVAMKKDIHPKYNEEAKVFCNGEEVLTVSGCKPEYVVDVWSGNHPFYTGALTTSVGEESRIAQFQKRYGGLYGEVAPVSAGGNTKLTYKKPDGKNKKKK